MTLRARFTLALTALSLFLLLLTGVAVFRTEDRYVVRKERERQAAILEDLAQGCATAIHSRDPAAIMDYAFAVARSAGLAYAGCLEPDGRLLFASDPAFPGRGLPAGYLDRALTAGDVPEFLEAPGAPLVLAMAVRDGKRRLGTALLTYDPQALAARRFRIVRNNLKRFAAIAAGAVVLSVLFSSYLGAALARPIRDVAKGARVIGEGDLAHRIPAEGPEELRRLSAEFNRMAERLQELDRLKEDFLASVTHELRSPMSSVIGFADMLLGGSGGPLSPKQEEWIQTLRSSAGRLSRMINNILDLAKLEAGLMPFEREEVLVGELAEETAREFEPVAVERKVRLSVAARDSSPAWADAESVRQVLANLLSNALKFAPAGGAVTVEVIDHGAEVRATVRDTGPGIPQEAMGNLFSKFFQIRRTRDRARGPGTGLGLAISKAIVEAQGGRIRVESPGPGAAFSFTLPRRRDD